MVKKSRGRRDGLKAIIDLLTVLIEMINDEAYYELEELCTDARSAAASAASSSGDPPTGSPDLPGSGTTPSTGLSPSKTRLAR